MATRSTVTDPPAEETYRPPRHAGRNKELEDWLDAQGVPWRFHPDVPLDAFNEADSLNNQVRFTPLTPATVDQYAKAMTEGAKFPPVLVNTKRGKFVRLDGNHRVAAKRQIGDPTIHAYEALVTGQPAVLLAFKANNRNGLPNTEEERINHAIWLLRNGASLAVAAAECVVSERALRAAYTREQANQRADEVGILRPEWEALTPSVRGRLRNISTDEGFKAATALALKAKMGLEEVNELIAEINQSKSGRKQEAVVKAYTEVYSDRIKATAGGKLNSAGKGRGRTSRQAISMVLGSLAALPEDLTVLANDYAGQDRIDMAERSRAAGERLLALSEKLSASEA